MWSYSAGDWPSKWICLFFASIKLASLGNDCHSVLVVLVPVYWVFCPRIWGSIKKSRHFGEFHLIHKEYVQLEDGIFAVFAPFKTSSVYVHESVFALPFVGKIIRNQTLRCLNLSALMPFFVCRNALMCSAIETKSLSTLLKLNPISKHYPQLPMRHLKT